MTESAAEATITTDRRSGWLRRVILLALAVLVTIAIARLLGAIDWVSVGRAFAQLAWWQPIVLFVVLLARQTLNASPLHFYIPGVSLFRATVNDLGASTMAVVAPPPSDMALRVAMFTSWGIKASPALAGTVMNTVTFFIIRFSAPLVGFVVVIIGGRSVGIRWLDLISLLIAAAILTAVLLVVRTDQWARLIGLWTARLVRKLRRTVDPEVWADACSQFRDDIASRFRYAFPRSVVTSLLMLACDITILLLALRFVGVSSGRVSVLEVAIAFLFAFPLTAFPMQGMGIVDMLILASLIEAGGDLVQEPALAALIIWRAYTVAGPLLLGIGAIVLWRRTRNTVDGT